jgi:type IV fimbrial biogenesis protein FimT
MRITISHGFTLIELLVTVSIISMLSFVAIPSFLELFRTSRLATQTHAFLTAANFARHEAIMRGSRTVICARIHNICRTDQKWENGWIIFLDNDADMLPDNGALIREFPSLSPNYILSPNVNTASLVYLPDGTVRRGSGALPLMTFKLCAPDAAPGNISQRSREIVINASGRMRVQFGREGITAC